MRLHRHAREWYVLDIATDPPVTAWEASFDGGTTWAVGAPAGTGWRWLVHGPMFPADPSTTSTPITKTIVPLIRATDTPEVLVRDAPYIILV